MKHLLCIEANTTGSGMIALQKAHELGLQPVFVTSAPDRYVGLEATHCPILLCETNDREALCSLLERTIHVEDISGIFTTSEFYLEMVAQLAAFYRLEGNPPESIRLCRDKALTRERLAPELLQPGFAVVTQEADLPGAIQKIGLPCIVKPVDESGSDGVRLCTSLSELERQAVSLLNRRLNARKQKAIKKLLLEEYIDAPEYSVEMFSWRGSTRCLGITEKTLTGFPHFVEHRHIFPAPLPHDVSQEMVRVVQRALAIIGITHGATHTEVKLTPQGPLIIEINARLAGGMIPELMQRVLGIDVLAQHIKVASGEEPEFPIGVCNDRYAGIQFITAPSTGLLHTIQGQERARSIPGVAALSVVESSGKVVSPPRSASDRLGYIIACAASSQEVQRILTEAYTQLSCVIQPLVS